ncbi:MAG TPA: SRPBCC family protein [Saprospiraceae bacterium]|nr:SRPBCC family protein [Saprospiraceae bacterium]
MPSSAPIPKAGTGYHFITHWRFQATCEEIYRILEDVDALAQWWPSVYLDVKIREKGQPGGVGKVVELYTKGWLPYTLRWSFVVTQTQFPTGFSLQAIGDFAGAGVWHFEQDGHDCLVTYDWHISAEKPLLKKMSWLLKPLFSANHHWAMKMGYASLQLELQRRRGSTGVAPAPGPTFPHNFLNNKIL